MIHELTPQIVGKSMYLIKIVKDFKNKTAQSF
jgi:hypothetical protein